MFHQTLSLKFEVFLQCDNSYNTVNELLSVRHSMMYSNKAVKVQLLRSNCKGTAVCKPYCYVKVYCQIVQVYIKTYSIYQDVNVWVSV
jgi:hypothetical protein